jgi:hypothetical protein
MSDFHGEYNIADYRTPVIAYFDIELDDAMLSPYAARAYMRIARRCAGGNRQCTESVANMAVGCRMSERKMYDALKELADRKMIIVHSRPGATSIIGLLGKESWLPFEDTPALNAEPTPAPRAEGSAPRAEVPLHHVQTKYTSKVNKKDNTRSSGSKNPHYDCFAQKYEETYKYPYQSKKADFVQFAVWKKADAGRTSDSDFAKAVSNYLASPLGQHTFASLVCRFATFRLSALDRYGKPVETKTPTPGSAAPLPTRPGCSNCVGGWVMPKSPKEKASKCACQEVKNGVTV